MQFGGCGPSNQKSIELNTITAFVHVNVVPMEGDTVLENYTVIIEKDKIRSLGPSSGLKTPRGCNIVDGTNNYLMPGLADMHAHLIEEDQMILFIANGVTTIRNMWGDSLHLALRDGVNRGELLGPTIYTAGALLDADPPVFPEMSVVVDSPDQVRAVVKDQKRAGYDFLKIYNNLSPQVYDAIINEAIEADMEVSGHVPIKVGLKHVLASKQRCIEHLDGYEAELIKDQYSATEYQGLDGLVMAWTMVDLGKISDIVQQTVHAGIWNCPTLIVYEKWVPPEKAKEQLNQDKFRYLSPAEIEFHRPENSYPMDFTPEIFEAVVNGNPIRKALTKALNDAGARILLGTDCGNPLVVQGFSIHEELQAFAEAGLSPYEAIKTGTYDAAEFLHGLNEFGTIREDKRADLILVESNPLEDVRNINKRIGVMVRGKWFTENQLKAKLNQLADKYINQ